MLTTGSDLRAQMDQLFDDNNCIPRVAIETREYNATPQYVVLNFGISILPQVPIMKVTASRSCKSSRIMNTN